MNTSEKINKILDFPTQVSDVFTGKYDKSRELLITGHVDGEVILWDLKSNEYKLIDKFSSQINTISFLSNDEIIVGSDSGGVDIISLENGLRKISIFYESNIKGNRVWRSIALDENSFVLSCAYGKLYFFNRKNGGDWNYHLFRDNNHSIFGMSKLNSKVIATGAYDGTFNLWKEEETTLKITHSLKVSDKIEDIFWEDDNAFCILGEYGTMYYYEKDLESNEWREILRVDIGYGNGKSIIVSKEEKMIFIGTNTEIIQFSLETELSKSYNLSNCIKLFSEGDQLKVLTNRSFISLKKDVIISDINTKKFKMVKVSLIGHTMVGKSSFCDRLIFNKFYEGKSTFGRKIWEWDRTNEDNSDKKIIFYDYGGQETILKSLLNFTLDSQLILIFFNQRDNRTFEIAKNLLKNIRSMSIKNIPIILVKTQIDEEIDDINPKELSSLLNEYENLTYCEISSKIPIGVKELGDTILNHIDWNNINNIIQSDLLHKILLFIQKLQTEKLASIEKSDFKRKFNEEFGDTITEHRLNYLLNYLEYQGFLEYYPKISNSIIFYDEKMNKCITKFLQAVDWNHGIINVKEVIEEISSSEEEDKEYLQILDQLFINRNICLHCNGRRIFPMKLTNEPLVLEESIKEKFRDSEKFEKKFKLQEINYEFLLKKLIDNKLTIYQLSLNEGIMGYGENAILYYNFEKTGDAITGTYINCSYHLAGNNEVIKERLKKSFEEIIDSLLKDNNNNKNSKNNSSNANINHVNNYKFQYDVALTFASENRDYARELNDIFSREGILVFYDKSLDYEFWGADLGEYLNEIFYKKAKWCIMLISKYYREKMWPTVERRAALARQIKQKGEYILPIRFDDTEIPGLSKTIGYLNAKEYSPEKVLETFKKKTENK